MLRGLFITGVAFAATFSGALAQEASGPLTTEMAQQRLQAYVNTWSSNEEINPSSVGHYYADRVIYYGKAMSREQILRDKLHYINAWPERHYRILPGTVSAACDGGHTTCRVSGIMAWDRRSRTGRTSIGSARLTLILSKGSGGRIARESASIQSR